MALGRPRKFNRVEVLEKAIPVFWEHGFADTSLADLEAATGVNRSGLYSEFRDKEDLFLASLSHYLNVGLLAPALSAQPRGWANVESYLRMGLSCWTGQKGCYSVSAMRDLAILPPEALSIVEKSMKPIKQLLISNIEAEKPKMNASSLADMTMTFFSGISIEQNLANTKSSGLERIEVFLQVMRSL